jgi:hypothetical protein
MPLPMAFEIARLRAYDCIPHADSIGGPVEMPWLPSDGRVLVTAVLLGWLVDSRRY